MSLLVECGKVIAPLIDLVTGSSDDCCSARYKVDRSLGLLRAQLLRRDDDLASGQELL